MFKVDLGTIAEGSSDSKPNERIVCDDPALLPHLNKTRVLERINAEAARYGLAPAPTTAARTGAMSSITVEELGNHAVIAGASGTGKSRLALHLIREQIKAGCSVVVLDPKPTTIEAIADAVKSAGIASRNLTLIEPRNGFAPRWNLLNTPGVSVDQAAETLSAILEEGASGSWGPRLEDIMRNALIVVATHGLSVLEFDRFLSNDEYRENLLAGPPISESIPYTEARNFFVSQYANWTKSERTTATASVLNKTKLLITQPYFRAMFCHTSSADKELDFEKLWREHSAVLVHLDEDTLGKSGTRLLGGLIAHQLRLTAKRMPPKNHPVLLVLDEMGAQQKFIGSALVEIGPLARESGLRLLVACQFLDQIHVEVRNALFKNSYMKAYLRLENEDAAIVAASLESSSEGDQDAVTSRPEGFASRVAALEVKFDDTVPEYEQLGWMPIFGANNQPAIKRVGLPHRLPQSKPNSCAQELAALYQCGLFSVFVNVYDPEYKYLTRRSIPTFLKTYEKRDEVRVVTKGDMGLTPKNELVLQLPWPPLIIKPLSSGPKQQQKRSWKEEIRNLPRQHAVLRIVGQEPTKIKVVDVPDLPPDPRRAQYLDAARRHNGQDETEVRNARMRRDAEIEKVASGGSNRGSAVAPHRYSGAVSEQQQSKAAQAKAAQVKPSQPKPSQQAKAPQPKMSEPEAEAAVTEWSSSDGSI